MDDDVKELIERILTGRAEMIKAKANGWPNLLADVAVSITLMSEANAESQALMAELFHAVNHKRDVWKTASASQKVSASNDLNVAMENIKISKSYQSYRQELSEKELIERLGITSADINVPPEVASETDEAIAALTRLSEVNAILKNTIQDLTTYTPEMIKQELAAKDARIEELEANNLEAMQGCFDMGIEEGARALTARNLNNDPTGFLESGRVKTLKEVVERRQALSEGET